MEEVITELVFKQGVFAVLFVWLLFNTRNESKQREEKLINHLDRTTDTLERIEQSISGMQDEIKDIREQMEAK